MLAWMEALAGRFPCLRCMDIGGSVLGRPLRVMEIGTGEKELFFSAAHHGNEWITALLLLRFAFDCARACAAREDRGLADGRALREALGGCRLYMLPLVNPDGVDAALGLPGPDGVLARLAKTQPACPVPRGWKANLHGTDLNLNYPAQWERARKIKAALGVRGPGPRDWPGERPLCEPESRALFDFTRRMDFRLVLAFHSQGREIYWRYGERTPPEAARIGRALADASGYALADTPYASSFAGYKDWFIEAFGRPGFTVEAGFGENPLPLSDFPRLYKETAPLMLRALTEAKKL